MCYGIDPFSNLIIRFKFSQIRPLLEKLEERVCDGASEETVPPTFYPYKDFAQEATKIIVAAAAFIDASVQELQIQVGFAALRPLQSIPTR